MIILETERLTLRHIGARDAQFILSLLNDSSFIRNIGDKRVRTLSNARSYIRNNIALSYERFGFGLYLVELKESGVPMGICGLVNRESLPDVDIGFAFMPEFWSKGYATESALAVMRHAIEDVELERIVAVTNPDNSGSISVLEKIGLKYERMIRLGEDEREIKLYAYDVVPNSKDEER